MKLTDGVALDGARLVDSGYLEANARTARTGVQQYLGREVGRPDLDIVNVYRAEDQVFSKASLETFSKLPLTNDHPAEQVTADNWRRLAVGVTGDEVLRDGDFLKIGLKITDAAMVKAVQAGKRDLSVGYTTELIWEDGVAPDGTPYQARQTAIIANHIAIVAKGRAGAEVRIGDGAGSWGASPVTVGDRSMTTRTILIDGLSVELTDKDAQIVERTISNLTKSLADANAKATTDAKEMADKHAKEIEAKDAEIKDKDKALAKAEAERDDFKAKVLTDAALDKRVAERSALLASAKAIAPKAALDGLGDAAIRKAAVVAALGDAAVADKAEAYIDARFDILVEGLKADPIKAALLSAPPPTGDAAAGATAAQAAMTAALTDAWKGK